MIGRRRGWQGAAAMLAIAAAWALAGCGGGSGNSTATDGPASRSIGPAGGTVTSSDGRLTLDFPPGSLAAANTITIEPVDVDDLPGEFDVIAADKAYDLRPDGLSFDQPVTARFDLGGDPIADDGSIRMPLALLLTRGNGAPAPLANLTQDVDPATGLTRVSGELSHFSPIVFAGGLVLTNSPTFVVINGVPDGLPADETFTAQVIVGVDIERSEFDAVGDVLYRDVSSRPPLTEPDPNPQAMPRDGPAFVAEIEYGCTETGQGTFGAAIQLTGVRYDFETGASTERKYTIGVLGPVGTAGSIAAPGATKQVTCTAPEGGSPATETAMILRLPGDFPPGPPTRLRVRFEPFDEATDPANALFGLVTGDGQAGAYDDALELQDQFFTGASGDFRFASAAVSYEFVNASGETERQDGFVVGGADGGVLFQRFGDFGARNQFTMGNVTDLYAFDQFSDDGIADTFAGVDFSAGELFIFDPDPVNGSFAETDGSGLITNAAVGGEALVSGHIPYGGFNDPGEVVFALTNPDPVGNSANGKVWRCERTENAGAPGVDCEHEATVGKTPLRIRGARADANGDTVVAVTSFDDQRLSLFRANVYSGGMTRIDDLEDIQAVTAAVRRVGDSVAFVASDFDGDALIGGRVLADDTVEVQRIEAPSAPPVNDPGGEPIACRGPEHSRLVDIAGTLYLLATCAGDPTTASVLLLLSFTAFAAGSSAP